MKLKKLPKYFDHKYGPGKFNPISRETPIWTVPKNPKPTSKWVQLLVKLRTLTTNTDLTKQGLAAVMQTLYEGDVVDKFQIVGTNKIAWKISEYGEEVLQKLGL